MINLGPPSQIRRLPQRRLTGGIRPGNNPNGVSTRWIMLAYLFVIFAVLTRMPFMPHPWNFTPVAAALLYFGARGSRRQLWFPFVLLAASDVILTKFVYSYPLTADQLIVWAWYAAILFLGTRLGKNSNWLWIGTAALASSVSFFLASNFAVWAFGTMYPKTVSGLMTCYAAGVPFFRRGLAGDMLFTTVMFGMPALAALVARSVLKPQGTAAA
ncbi:MAG TPA: DUF6580 family putative transport protein [Terriglobales bacterium]|jgi:hypothetical protein|nr:DUF6580 family putative transport protein [Terriglobales bacterium]